MALLGSITVASRPFLGTAQSDLSARKPYDIIDEPGGKEYWGLIDGALQHCSHGVLRADRESLDAGGLAVLDDLAPFALEEPPQGGLGGVVRFTLNVESAAILKTAANRLYDWLQPKLPSDLCLFRYDGSPWLMTIASEALGYVELTTFEKLLLAQSSPELPGALVHRAARDAILAVFEQRYETALTPLVKELSSHTQAFLDEGRDGLVEALGVWLHASDSTRVTVALKVITELGLDEFVDEIDDMRNDVYAGRIAIPSVFSRNSVLADRWLAELKTQLDHTLSVLSQTRS